MDINVTGAPTGLSFEVQQMPPDGSNCFECKEPVFGKMFQWFMFSGNTEATATKFKLCEVCYDKL